MREDTKERTSTSYSFVDNLPLVTPQNVGPITLTATDLHGGPNILNCVSWLVTRNPAEEDLNLGGLPKITYDSNNPTRATLDTEAEGSFNVSFICTNNSRTKTLAVMNFVILRVKVDLRFGTNEITTDGSLFNARQDAADPNLWLACSGQNPDAPGLPITFAACINILGGDADRMLGVYSADAGWFQTLAGFGAQIEYSGKIANAYTDPKPRCLDPGNPDSNQPKIF